ncbi:hypothetical protein HYV64_00725 [Candidatus Shapirobacteria bacterium]|nr:hypothetical protein [Candidatus Shapirobacteria bacterium]
MTIDSVSENLFKIALYLEKLIPGMVSEVWIDDDLLNHLKNNLPDQSNVLDLICQTKSLIREILDEKRKQYLKEVLQSLEFQINSADKKLPYEVISEKTFGYKITRVGEKDIRIIEEKIRDLETKIGLSRQEIYIKNLVNPEEYKSVFEKNIQTVKDKLPASILDFPDGGFLFETTINKPWSAFNSHIAPFKSKLTLNTDLHFNTYDLFRLSSHEAYGGHHSELSNKDKLLVERGFGEHGLVINLSPQTFISEAIAEGIYILLKIADESNLEEQLTWYYNRLTFALQNLATFLYNDDGKSVEEIRKTISEYYISDATVNLIVNFSTDPVFGKYAPVYYSAFNFLSDLFQKSLNKNELIETLFTKPCTPELLTKK